MGPLAKQRTRSHPSSLGCCAYLQCVSEGFFPSWSDYYRFHTGTRILHRVSSDGSVIKWQFVNQSSPWGCQKQITYVKGRLSNEPLVTVFAGIRFLSGVSPLVQLMGQMSSERIVAVPAHVRTLSGVRHLVLLDTGFTRKGLWTVRALERFCSGMDLWKEK